MSRDITPPGGIDDAYVQAQVDRYVEGYREGRQQAIEKIEAALSVHLIAVEAQKNRRHPTQRWWGEYGALNRIFEIIQEIKTERGIT